MAPGVAADGLRALRSMVRWGLLSRIRSAQSPATDYSSDVASSKALAEPGCEKIQKKNWFSSSISQTSQSLARIMIYGRTAVENEKGFFDTN